MLAYSAFLRCHHALPTIDIRDMTQHSLRSQIGNVQQDVFYSPGPLKKMATENWMRWMMKLFQQRKSASEDLMHFLYGYETRLRTRLKLSGGQKQRLPRPHALKNPPILILDEAIRSRYRNERIIQQSLAELLKPDNPIIAHRL